MKKLIISLALLVLLPYNLYADVWKNPTVEDVRIEGSSTVEICSGTGDIKLSTGCGGAGTIYSITLDATDGSFDFAGNIALENDQYLTGEDTSGTARNLIGVDTSSDLVIGINNGFDDTMVYSNDDIFLTANDDIILTGNGAGDAIYLRGGTTDDLTIADNVITVAGGTDLVFNGNTHRLISDTDAKSICLGGGSTCSATVGANLYVFGASEATNPGDLHVAAGNVSGGEIRFFQSGLETFKIVDSSSSLLQFSNGNGGIYSSADNTQLTLSGGSTLSAANSALISLYGNSFSGTPGVLQLSAGDVTNASINLYTTDSTGVINSRGVFRFAAPNDAFYGNYMTVNTVTGAATLAGATTTAVTVPADTVLLGCTSLVTTTITGATSWDLGVSGGDTDLYGATLALTASTTAGPTNYTADPRDGWNTAARNIIATANGSNFTGGALRTSCHYISFTTPTG